MVLQLFNTLQGKVSPFHKSPGDGAVTLYTCGPTVYDYAHIGNFRSFVFEDLLRRFLEFKDHKVKHVMNITDVDDKTIAGANREGKKLEEFTSTYIEAFREDLRKLNIFEPNGANPAYRLIQPRATEEIQSMIALISKLIEKGHAYVSDGSVYYRVALFQKYGQLSHKKLEHNIQGARVDVDEYEKEEGADFVLWKKSREGDPAWDSPWGKGRPGWHIECSAMSMKYLGESFDIHAGGEDLIFPHHENEIAQSEAATGKPFVQVWVHCKFLLVNGEKMSKSKGNFYTLRDLLEKGHDPMAIRYALLAVHYRTPLNFTMDSLKEAAEVIKRMDECYSQCLGVAAFAEDRENPLADKNDFKNQPALKKLLEDIVAALDNDLNISIAFAKLFEAVKEINAWFPKAAINGAWLRGAIYFFKQIDELFGFDIAKYDTVPRSVVEMLQERMDLRRQKKFDQADQLRKRISEETDWLAKDTKDIRPGMPAVAVKKRRRMWDAHS